MKKLNSIIYQKLLLQAEEAKDQNLTKLASNIMGALELDPEDNVNYASTELINDIHNGLWKLSTCVLKYNNLSSVDAEKLDDILEVLAYKFVNEIEESLGVDKLKPGTLEPLVPGESK